MSKVKTPEGYRKLRTGETIRPGDIYDAPWTESGFAPASTTLGRSFHPTPLRPHYRPLPTAEHEAAEQ